jgi:hypothetical protein
MILRIMEYVNILTEKNISTSYKNCHHNEKSRPCAAASSALVGHLHNSYRTECKKKGEIIIIELSKETLVHLTTCRDGRIPSIVC